MTDDRDALNPDLAALDASSAHDAAPSAGVTEASNREVAHRADVADVRNAVDHDVVRELLERSATRKTLTAIVAARVRSAEVEEVVPTAMTEALESLDCAPPERADAILAWVGAATRRAVAEHLAKRARRSRFEGAVPGAGLRRRRWGDDQFA
jgi:hypothetical protein